MSRRAPAAGAGPQVLNAENSTQKRSSFAASDQDGPVDENQLVSEQARFEDTSPSETSRVVIYTTGLFSGRETRATLIAAIARGRQWLNELIDNSNATAETIAKREGFSARQVNMTISLAFVAPDIVKAAIEGRLPHGIGIARLRDAPVEWSRQHAMLGLPG